MNETADDYARVSGQDRKKPPALGSNQIAGFVACVAWRFCRAGRTSGAAATGFGKFRPLGNCEKNKFLSYHCMLTHIDIPAPAVIGLVHVTPTSLMQHSGRGFIWTSNQMSRGVLPYISHIGMCRPIG